MILFFSPLIKSFLRIILIPREYHFNKSLKAPKKSQEKVFKKLIDTFNSSAYGKEIGQINTISEFQSKVPLISFDEISSLIQAMKEKGENHFSPSPVLFYEPTSGSSGSKKDIPYTLELKSAFSQMFSLWVLDLIKNGPSFKSGKFYFSVSPQFKESDDSLQDDSDYIEGFFSWFLKPFFVTPKKIKLIKDPILFKKALALHLLAEEDLEIISIWNPSTFTILLDYIEEYREELLIDLEKGICIIEGHSFKLKKITTERKELIRKSPLQELWPKLKFVSSWGDKEAKPGFLKIKKIFPSVFIQAKGLLATEAPITIPVIASHSFVPLLESIFFEFISTDGKVHLLHELKGGEVYKLVITTPGGLYRYLLGDKVRVPHFYKETPCLEFMGRGEETSDLFGEKLHKDFLTNILQELKTENYYSFFPTRLNEDHGYYTLLTDNKDERLEKLIESSLMKAYHYKVARKLGTLGPLKIIYKKDMNERVLNYIQEKKGMKLGDIKPSVLLDSFDDKYLI
ncbi:MAG: hypothetical protein ACJAT2_001875 [Bacteriovoracaceae bacterium]|jgi:hypothetical protein